MALPYTPSEYADALATLRSGNAPKVRALQAAWGLDPDGAAGPNTWGALELRRPAGLVPPMPARGGPYHRQSRGDVRAYSLRAHGPAFALSPNFRLVEFACKDGSDRVLVHPALVALLEEVRAHFGAPVHVNSGYRTPEHNKRVGGATDSRHVWGFAADFTVRGVKNSAVRTRLRQLEVGGIGTYASWTHCDVDGYRRRWTGP